MMENNIENLINDAAIELALRQAVVQGDFTESVIQIIRKVYKIGFIDGAKYMVENKDKWKE